jgi:uncharacterized membrane protein
METIATLAAFGLALTAIWRSGAAQARLETLAGQVRRLEARLLAVDQRLQRFEAPPAPMPSVEAIAAAAEPPAQPPAPAAALNPLPPAGEEGSPRTAARQGGRSGGRGAVLASGRWEQVLAENWLVWLGGVTLALGGAFLVKLSIDYGLLTPAVRVTLGVLLGVGLAAAADRLARREPTSGSEPPASSYVPQALAAAGAATVFASLYAAYQLYHLLPAILAFPLLAATAAAAVVMSLRHGPLVAALGLVGAYLVPLLVQSGTPQALALFGYLAFVSAASLAVVRHRAWWWLAWLALAGAVFWVLSWLGQEGFRPETSVVGGFLLVQLALFGAFRRGIARVAFLAGVGDAPMVRAVTRAAFWVLAAATLVLVHVDGFGNPSLATALLAAIFLLWFGYHDTGLDDVIAAAGALLLGVLATWNLPLTASLSLLSVYARQPVEVADFATASIAFALLLAGGGFIALWRTPRPGRWAALSAAAPLLILLIAYWRVRNFVLDLGWSSVALALAGLELAAAGAVARRRGAPQIESALAAYAAGVLGGTILAATLALSNAWLTVALALHLPALGWVEGRIRLPALRRLALLVAGSVLVRLMLNPYLLDYPLSATPIFNWLLYGYGVPALAFVVATRQFGSRADDMLVWVLEAGSIAFSAMLLTFELRHALYGRLDAPLAVLGRDAAQALLWFALAAALLRIGERRRRPVLYWGGIILFGLATVQAVLWQALIADPLLTGEPVGRYLIFDVPTLAFALPALLYAGIVWFRLGPNPLRWVARIAAASLAFLWLTLEIRHAFRGEVLTWGETGEGEWYAYSAAWLVFAGAGLAVGLVRGDDWLRRAALAGVGLVVAKVFVSDMSALSGVLRALSFLGLGGGLVGIGYAYRRLRPLQQG